MAKGKKDKITGEVSFQGSHHIISSSLAQNFQLYFYVALLKVLGSKMDGKKPATTMLNLNAFFAYICQTWQFSLWVSFDYNCMYQTWFSTFFRGKNPLWVTA